MTTDNQKYEEAAEKYATEEGDFLCDPIYTKMHFLAGASFAEKENDKFILQLKEHIEGQQNSAEIIARGLHSRDKEIEQFKEENQRLKSSMKTLLQAWQRGDSYEFYEDLIEKHKLIEP